MTEDLWLQNPPVSQRLGLAFPTDQVEIYDQIAQMGIGIVRVSASWKRVETDGYNYSGLDYRLRALSAAGIHGFLTFESDHPDLAVHTDQVKNGTPKEMQRWAEFVQAVVERYDGDGIDDMPGLSHPVLYVQAGNEFLSPRNRSGGWADSDEALVAYFQTTYDAVKRADASMPVVLGGLASFNTDIALLADGRADFDIRQNWSATKSTRVTKADLDDPDIQAALRRLDTVLRFAPYDMVDTHLYGPETRDAMRLDHLSNRGQAPVLSSECGGPTTDYGQDYSGHRHFAAVIERNLAVLASGARFCLWFGLNERLKTTYSNRHTPLFSADMAPKPGVDAYRLLASLLSDGGAVRALGPRQYHIETDNGPICVALGQKAKALPQIDCTNPKFAACVVDAATRTAQLVPAATLPASCPGEAIAFSGTGLSPILKRNRQR